MLRVKACWRDTSIDVKKKHQNGIYDDFKCKNNGYNSKPFTFWVAGKEKRQRAKAWSLTISS